MAKYEDGDAIPLHWEGPPAEMFVRGHVTKDEFLESVKAHYGGFTWAQVLALAGCKMDSPLELERKWARWSMEPTPDGNGHILRTYDEPGRGRFPVTCVDTFKGPRLSGPELEKRRRSYWDCRDIGANQRRQTILAQVVDERHKQDEMWGGAYHDDGHSPLEWAAILHRETVQATDGVTMEALGINHADQYARGLVKVAAVAVAALESLDRLTKADLADLLQPDDEDTNVGEAEDDGG